jgi:lipopolysaccharide/colanic/teichoic acid biosynthesis glycosyltransferase
MRAPRAHRVEGNSFRAERISIRSTWLRPKAELGDRLIKRSFDVIGAGTGLLVLLPLLLVVAILVKVTSRGPVLFTQERIGRGFRPFRIYKFRSMVRDAPAKGSSITFGQDPRITSVGRMLRKTKMDEFPQLFNVLRGDMSFVGPRPEVCEYVEEFRQDYEKLLTVRPGITGLASVKYVDEAAVLAKAADPDQEYRRVVLPEKIRLDVLYVEHPSMWLDFKIIMMTLVRIVKH